MTVPFINTIDTILGTGRRYSYYTINNYAKKYSLSITHKVDKFFDYYIIN